jgi:DNA-entry nuclease
MKAKFLCLLVAIIIVLAGCSDVSESEGTPAEDLTEYRYILNTNSKKIHLETCFSVRQMLNRNKKYTNESIRELKEKGYTVCQNCNPE